MKENLNSIVPELRKLKQNAQNAIIVLDKMIQELEGEKNHTYDPDEYLFQWTGDFMRSGEIRIFRDYEDEEDI